MLFALLIGLGVGLSSTFLGLGGGLLIVPLLPFAVPITAKQAIATSLLTVFLVACQNAWSFHRERRIDWRAAITIGACSAIGAFVAGRLVNHVSELFLHWAFGLLVFVVGIKTIKESGGGLFAAPRELSRWVLIGFGLLNGVVSGFTGIGGGIFVVPILSIYRMVEPAKVVPTSVATIVLTSFAGALGVASEIDFAQSNLYAANLRIDLAAALFVGAVVSSVLARPYQQRLSGRKRDWLIGVLLLALSIRTAILIVGD